MQELRDAGYLPEAVRNYLALLGWGADDDETIFSTEELSSASRSSASSATRRVFDEQKLRWMNGHYIRELDVDELTGACRERSPAATGSRGAVEIAQEKIQTLADFWPLAGPSSTARRRRRQGARAVADRARGARRSPSRAGALAALEPFDVEHGRRGAARRRRARSASSRSEVFQPLRVALTGTHGLARDLRDASRCSGATRRSRRIDAALAAL